MDTTICPVPEHPDNSHLFFSNFSGEMTPYCTWLTDLATAKNNGKLRALYKITLTEYAWNKWNRHDGSCMHVDWNTPHIIVMAFYNACIEFTARVRAVNTARPRGCMFTDPEPVGEVAHEFYVIYQREPEMSAT
jgi:hypothetical protein